MNITIVPYKKMQIDDFTEVDDLHKDFSDVNFLGRMLLPALQSFGERFHELEMRYRIMTTIFELKLQQQKNGNLPEKFDLPTDWFSGQKCLFSKRSTRKNNNLEYRTQP